MSEYSTAPIFSPKTEERVRELAREEIAVALSPPRLPAAEAPDETPLGPRGRRSGGLLMHAWTDPGEPELEHQPVPLRLYRFPEGPDEIWMVHDDGEWAPLMRVGRYATNELIRLARAAPDEGACARALRALVRRLDEVHADPAYQRVWGVAQATTGEQYVGPQYSLQLEVARVALRSAALHTAPEEGEGEKAEDVGRPRNLDEEGYLSLDAFEERAARAAGPMEVLADILAGSDAVRAVPAEPSLSFCLRAVIAYLDAEAAIGAPTDAPVDLAPSLRSWLARVEGREATGESDDAHGDEWSAPEREGCCMPDRCLCPHVDHAAEECFDREMAEAQQDNPAACDLEAAIGAAGIADALLAELAGSSPSAPAVPLSHPEDTAAPTEGE